MSITAIGTLGNTTETSTDRTTACPLSRGVAAGRVVVAWLAVDSTFSIFVPTQGEGYWYPTDSKGNIWTTLGSYTDDRDFFRAGGQIIIAICQLQTALTSSDTVSFTAAAGLDPGGVFVRAISLEEFDFDGDVWAASAASFQGRRDAAAQPGNIGKTFNKSREWLMLHGLATEGPVTDSYTWDSDYTQIVPNGSNSGTPSSDITLNGGYRIATLSTDAVEVTNLTSGTRDSVQLLGGVCAVKPYPGFPLTPVLDDFNRANENPLDSAFGWDDTAGITAHFSDHAQILSNVAAGSGGSFWDTTIKGCGEVYATMSTLGEGYLHFNAYNTAATGSMDGSAVGLIGASQDAINNIISGRTNIFGGVLSVKCKTWPVGFGNGDKIGYQRTLGAPNGGLVNHTWLDTGSGWTEVCAFVIDPGDFPGNPSIGRMALECAGTIVRWDDFGGGHVPCGTAFVPQEFRRHRGAS